MSAVVKLLLEWLRQVRTPFLEVRLWTMCIKVPSPLVDLTLGVLLLKSRTIRVRTELLRCLWFLERLTVTSPEVIPGCSRGASARWTLFIGLEVEVTTEIGSAMECPLLDLAL